MMTELTTLAGCAALLRFLIEDAEVLSDTERRAVENVARMIEVHA